MLKHVLCRYKSASDMKRKYTLTIIYHHCHSSFHSSPFDGGNDMVFHIDLVGTQMTLSL